MIIQRRSYKDLIPVLLCILILGVGGFYVAINTVILPSVPAPVAPTEPVVPIAPAPTLHAPRLISPPNGAIDIEHTPTFVWEEVANAEGYELVIAHNYDFSDIYWSVSTKLTGYQFVEGLEPSSQYYWMVCAKLNPADPNTPVAYSEIWTFSTPKPLPAPAPTPPPKPATQGIEYIMPAGSVAGSYVSYSRQLNAGEQVTGFVELAGQYYNVDWSYDWHFEILGPEGELLHDWQGHWVNTPYHDFSFTASHTGRYTLKVSHASSYPKNLIIGICPAGWG